MSSELICNQNQYLGPHFKMKSNLINKFFNEPVDALDLRLDKAEATLSSFRENPLEIKEEEIESGKSKHIEHPLDYSEVQIVPPESDSDPVYPQMPPLIWKTDQHERSIDSQPNPQRIALQAISSIISKFLRI